jgi:hypothetical protein
VINSSSLCSSVHRSASLPNHAVDVIKRTLYLFLRASFTDILIFHAELTIFSRDFDRGKANRDVVHNWHMNARQALASLAFLILGMTHDAE